MKDYNNVKRESIALLLWGNIQVFQVIAHCTRNLKITLFKAYCQCFHTSSLCNSYMRLTDTTLRIQYNNVFRALLGLPDYCRASGMFAEKRIDDFYAITHNSFTPSWFDCVVVLILSSTMNIFFFYS